MYNALDETAVNTIRFLAVDMVQKANSGHPGAPLGQSAMAYVLWDRFLKHNPSDTKWADRDRFILSAGHASAMLYALLHLTGYPLSLEELKNFRQWESLTPGHPEYGLVPGVEVTTGPLGQGFANGVGMAIAEKWLAGHYNRPGFDVINHRTYAIVSDGDLMEGVASEAASFAGTMKLGKIIYLYDDNRICIEGSTDLTFRENVGERFRAYGWNVIGPIDGMDLDAVDSAIRQAQGQQEKPTLIVCRTVIGFGSPNKAGSASAHGEPLGVEEVKLTKKTLKWPYEENFSVPKEVVDHCRKALTRGAEAESKWQSLMKEYAKAYPSEARQLEADLRGELPAGWDAGLTEMFASAAKPLATREASGMVLAALANKVHSLSGGSADLGPSTKTLMKDHASFGFESKVDHNLHFGVREHAMGAIANGMSLHGGLIPYSSTFLIFYDYMRPPVRLAALMGIRSIYVFTHDSIGLGEDGPTHQPIEQIMGMRLVPNLVTIRPADAAETAEAWKVAMERRNGPTALILSRQGLPVLDRKEYGAASGTKRGGYTLWQSSGNPQVIIMGTGSEVHIAFQAARTLQQRGVEVRVVSMPSWELFESQTSEYRESVLPENVTARVSVEAGVTLGWQRYIGSKGIAIGVDRFGASAPANVLYQKLGITAEHVVEAALRLTGH